MRTRVLTMCAVIVTMIAACGGDTTDQTTTTDSGATPTTADGATSTDAPTTTTTSAAPSSDDDPGDDSNLTARCLEATQSMSAAMSSYTEGLAGAMTGTLDADSLQLAAGQIEAMAEAAPDEIRDDMAVIAEELAAFYAALAEVDLEPGAIPTPAQAEALAELAEVVDQERFDEAAAEVSAWFEDNC